MDRIGRLLAALRALLVASVAGAGAAAPPGPALAQSDRDEADWLAARADGSRRAFERYLQRHPVGRHASEAFIIVARMSVETGWAPQPGEPILPEPDRRAATQVTEVY